MNLLSLIEHTRRHILDDAVSGHFRWDDLSITRWLNEAERRFAKGTRCFVDRTSDFTSVLLDAGEDAATLDPRVIRVLRVYDATGSELRKMQTHSWYPRAPSQPRAWSQYHDEISFFPATDAVASFSMLVERLPLQDMTSDTDTPEIPEQYHEMLCDWAGYRAMSSPDMQSQPDYNQQSPALYAKFSRSLEEARREYYQQRRG